MAFCTISLSIARSTIIWLVIILSFSTETFSQDLTFPIRSVDNIRYEHPAEVSKDYKKFPYLDMTVFIANADKLNNKEFVRNHFRNMKYFYGELVIGTISLGQIFPLFLYQNQDNKFNTSLTESRTILKKYLYRPDGLQGLEAKLVTKITREDGLLKVLNSVSETFGPLILNPTALMNPDMAVKTYKFFSVLLNQAAQGDNLQASVEFDGFENTYKRILAYKVYFFIPTDVPSPNISNLVLRKSSSGFYLQENHQEYTAFPYLIIMSTLSNYLDLPGLPSRRLNTGYTAVGDADIRYLDSTLLMNNEKLSDAQLFAERLILDHLKLINLLEKALAQDVRMHSAVVQAEIDETRLRNGYDGMLLFDDLKVRAEKIERELDIDQNAQLQPKRRALMDQAETYFNRLPHYKDLRNIQRYVDAEDLNNQSFGNLAYLLSKVAEVSYLKRHLIVLKAEQTLRNVENGIYTNKFKELCDRLATADEVNESYNKARHSLQEVATAYNHCSKCQTEAKTAMDKYGDLISKDEDRKVFRAINDTSFYCADIVRSYKSKFDDYNYLPDSIRTKLNLGLNKEFFNKDIADITSAIDMVRKNEKTKFTKNERKDIYAKLIDLKMLVARLEDNYGPIFIKMSQPVAIVAN